MLFFGFKRDVLLGGFTLEFMLFVYGGLLDDAIFWDSGWLTDV
jgi:hypothetical protein